jgi:hypothetical protein
MTRPLSLLETMLSVIFRQSIVAPDADTGIAHLAAVAGRDAPADAWREVVAEAMAMGYIHDPVRLPPGALQCHWHLELTPKGLEAAQASRSSRGDIA